MRILFISILFLFFSGIVFAQQNDPKQEPTLSVSEKIIPDLHKKKLNNTAPKLQVSEKNEQDKKQPETENSPQLMNASKKED